MKYEEAKQVAEGLFKDLPEQMRIMHFEGNNEEFVAIAYSPLTNQERHLVEKGGYRWDLLIKKKQIEYRQFYMDMDIRNKPVKALPRKIPISRVTRDQFSYFLETQLFITMHTGDL